MDAFIEDGGGTSDLVAVVHNELNVTTESEAMKANVRGDAYTVIVDDIDPGGGGQDWFYMKNNDTRNVVIYKIEGWCVDVNEEWNVLVGATAGTTAEADGDVEIQVNNNSGFANTADVLCISDDTNLAVTGGTILTTLKFHATTLLFETFNFPSGIILAPGTRLHMEAKVGGVVDMHLYFYMEDVKK